MHRDPHGERKHRAWMPRETASAPAIASAIAGKESNFSRCVYTKVAHAVEVSILAPSPRGASLQMRFRTSCLNSSRPCANSRVASAVRVQDSQRVRGAGFAVNTHHDAASAGEDMTDPAVMRLEPDAAHRAGNTDLG